MNHARLARLQVSVLLLLSSACSSTPADGVNGSSDEPTPPSSVSSPPTSASATPTTDAVALAEAFESAREQYAAEFADFLALYSLDPDFALSPAGVRRADEQIDAMRRAWQEWARVAGRLIELGYLEASKEDLLTWNDLFREWLEGMEAQTRAYRSCGLGRDPTQGEMIHCFQESSDEVAMSMQAANEINAFQLEHREFARLVLSDVSSRL